MRVPIAWLRDYVDLPEDSQAIADRLAQIGFPVESIERRPVLSGIVIGKIATLERHPNADRLLVASIDVGDHKRLSIATAATNVAVDQTIAVATIGAQLPQLKIERRKMRGFESEGMMISAVELGLAADWFEDGILQLNGDAQLGADAVELLQLRDDVLDVEITTNRPDAMAVAGLARELAASYGTALRLPPDLTAAALQADDSDAPRVTLQSKDCLRFVAQRFSNIRVSTSPLWMRVRLALAGQRPINNVVDISNYVMLDVGQPLHFYDAAKIAGNHLIARDAREGERLVTLDGVEHELSPLALVIADDSGAQGLAGLKGGKASEVSEATTSIILEAANFDGARIRRMSAALGLRTEASARHEKTLAPVLTDFGAARAATLLQAEGATAHAPRAVGHAIAPAAPIAFPVGDVKRLLGFELGTDAVAAHLSDLGFFVSALSPEKLSVVPPLWRRDVTASADVVEEIARMAGYDNVPAEIPALAPRDVPSAQYHLERDLARTLAALGYREIVSYSLHGEQARERFVEAGLHGHLPLAEVRNPLSADQRFLRPGLEPGFLDYFARVKEPLKIFEIGHVFEPSDPITERSMLGFAFAAEPLDEPPWRDAHFLRLKGDAETIVRVITGRYPQSEPVQIIGFHPGKTASLLVDGRRIAYIGRIDPRLARAYDLTLPAYVGAIDLDHLPPVVAPRFVAPSRFPSTYRDLALIVSPDVTAQMVEKTIAAAAGPLCKGVRVFDEYRGPQVGAGRKSLAARVTLQRDDATITDAEADAAISQALGALRSELGATVRA